MDLIALTFDSVAHSGAAGPILAFGAGCATAAGPCVAPRIVAVSAMTSHLGGMRRRLTIAGAVTAGTFVSYGIVASASTVAMRVLDASTWIYALCAICCGLAGIWAIAPPHRHCAGIPESRSYVSFGGAFLGGAASALVVSPCCTPVVVTIATLGIAAGTPGGAVVALAAFVAGHAMPLWAVALAGGAARHVVRQFQFGSAAGMVTGGLMLFLCGYYGALA